MMPEISYSDLQLRLQKLKDLDLSTVPYNEILNTINSEMVLPIVITEISAGNYIERIRINKDGEIFTSECELSYVADPKKITTFGRANSPASSMFYGSVISTPINFPRIVALAETEELLRSNNKGKTDKDLIITLGKWQIAENMLLAEMVFKKEVIKKTPEVKKAFDFHINSFREDMPETEVQKMILLLEFYSEEFAKAEIRSDTDYKLSAAYAESAFKRNIVQGIIYPSVRTEYEGSNVALLPNTVDNHLHLEEAIMIHVQIKGTKVFLDNIYRTGELTRKKEKFDWYEMNPASKEFKDTFFRK
ncbi:MAG: RES domain-containing protein [Chitinophagaceae bacterium]